jgi:hypothetical protein
MKKVVLKSGDVFIFNEEIETKVEGVVDELLSEASNFKNWGVIAPLILTKKDLIYWHGGYIAPNVNMPISYGAGEAYVGQFPGTRSVTCSLFYCAIIKKELVEALGLSDDIGLGDIFADADYCLQAIAKGFKILATDIESVRFLGLDPKKESPQAYANQLAVSAQAFGARWASLLDSHYTRPLCYQSRVSAPTGFALALSNYMKALSNAGVDVRYNFIGGAPEIEPPCEDMLVHAITEKMAGIKMPQVIWGQAPLFFKNSGDYKIGHCEFEGDDWPPSWVPYCNMMNELWVPTKWDRAKAIRAGVNVPIYVIAQGIDPDYFHPEIAPMEIEIKQTFKFIVTAAWLERKNLGNLIKTFARTFKKTDDVCLIIKTMNLGLVESIEDEIKKLNIPDDSGWIYVKEEDWPTSMLPSFYTMGNCFVLPTHGEGFGLPIFEALACGVPVITTAYGAPNELLRDDTDKKNPLPGVHLLNYHLVKSRDIYEYLKDNKWAEPSLEQLAEKMRYVYENYAKEKERALETSVLIRQKFAWSNVVKPILERLDAIYSEQKTQ